MEGGGRRWSITHSTGLFRSSFFHTDDLFIPSQILAEQQAGLAHLTKILQKDMKDLGVIMGTGAPVTAGDDSMSQDNLWNSTTSLRASVLR